MAHRLRHRTGGTGLEGRSARRPLGVILGLAVLVSGCRDPIEPGDGGGAAVATVDLTSPIGALLDVGGSAQLAATARDDAGTALGGVTFTWTTTAPAVVSVDGAGSIEAVAVGAATVRAAVASVSGSLALRVVDADLPGITDRATDPFAVALARAATAEVAARLEAALDECTSGAGEGSLERIQGCVAEVVAEAAAASDPTDRAVTAVLGLFTDDITRMLGL